MMTSTQFVFWLTFLLLGTMVQKTHLHLTPPVHRNSNFISAPIGENVTLQCFHERKDSETICWYRQTLGQQPKLIASFYVYGEEITFYDEFKNNAHFSLVIEDEANQLIISNLRISDSATYFCGISNAQVVTFAQGTVLSVKSSGSNVRALIHQLTSESIQPGRSVTLNCSVQTGSCGGEHTVYWFKDSDGFQPGFIYTHEKRNGQCERNSSTQIHTCVYNLPMKNLHVSDVDTNYCVVASCGHILFGNATMQNFSREKNVLKNVLVGTLPGCLTTLLVALLIFFACRLRKTSHQAKESQFTAAMTAPWINDQDTNRILYASINVDHLNKSRRQRSSSKTECVYSSLSLK
ncbi:hypothetical protein GOODEAATRI_007845 [Goodea atripinnis]|uniref:Ig-like domain-containing protein n=1 Tax=Goodea atripinnis TaxID=208336 RepID=A0ABV0N8U1_9TELE